jgi:hypothetical protein
VFENRVLRQIFGPNRDEVTGKWKRSVLPNKYYLGDQIKNGMGGACIMYGGKERCIQDFWWGGVREGDHLEDPGIDGRIILK